MSFEDNGSGEKFFENLEIDLYNGDLETYKQLIQANIHTLTNVGENFCRELYFDSSRVEIKFWIDFEDIQQSIHDIVLAP